MEVGKKRIALVLCALVCSTVALSDQGINARAVEDLKTFISKSEEGDKLFFQKKFSEAAASLAAAHELFMRADRRDSGSRSYKVTIKANDFPSIRYFGFGFGPNASLTLKPSGEIEGTAMGMNAAVCDMWQDAAILGGLDKFPMAGAFTDPSLVDMSDGDLSSVVSTLYGPVSLLKLPVPDDEWKDVVFWSRRALPIVEFALRKFPDWKSEKTRWSRNNDNLNMTGNEALADLKAKLAEAEPEYAKLASDFKNAAPKRAKDWLGYKIEDIDKAIAGAKDDGWVEWTLMRDIYITKDYLSNIRKAVAPMYTEEGKSMPADALKPLEDKVAALKSQMESGASRWKFPSGKPRNASYEAKVAAGVKSRIPGATILKTALDTSDWSIAKNDLGIPRYRTRHVLVLAKVPGQSKPWLVMGNFDQTYTGGGTYSSGGSFSSISYVRIQSD